MKTVFHIRLDKMFIYKRWRMQPFVDAMKHWNFVYELKNS